jgi:structure-specific endonuclease subunit SLX1
MIIYRVVLFSDAFLSKLHIIIQESNAMPFFVYFLKSKTSSKTYIGFTINLNRRLLQHNRELSGGAKATRGEEWERVCYLEGFETQKEALQFEWAWKYYSKKAKGKPLTRRLLALLALFNSTRITSKSTRALDNLHVNWESELDPFSLI